MRSYPEKGKNCGRKQIWSGRLLRLFTLLCIFSFAGSVLAQSKLSGKVTDADNGEPLVGVNIIIKGTTSGTISDMDGNYTLDLPGNEATLIFSSIGYEAKEVEAKAGNMDVQLEVKSEGLDEVVVVGYGTTKARDLTGAVSSVKAEDIGDQPFSSVDQALQGKVSGVTIAQNSGAPGGGISVRVRGITSLTGSNEPLYIVDGVPLDGNSNNDSFHFGTMGGESGQTKVSALSTINPSDILSIEILKDASATAIYGSRASNGVILISTKSGSKGKSKVSYDGYYGYQQITKYIDLMNLQEYAEYLNEIRAVDGQDPKPGFENPALLGEGTNWQKEIFRIAPVQSHQISISGGTEKTKVYTSLNYFEQDGILINTSYNRASLRLNLEHKVNDWFKLGNNLTATLGKEKIAYNDSEDGVITGALRQSPEVPVRYSDGSWGGPEDGVGAQGGYNPVAWSEIRSAKLERNKILGNLYAEIDFIEGLKFRSEIGYDFNLNKSYAFNPSYEIGTQVNNEGTSFKQDRFSFYWIAKNFLTYSKSFGKSSLTVMAGHEAQHSRWENIFAQRAGYIMNELTSLSIGDAESAGASDNRGQWAMQSAFTRANYSFNNRYLLTATLRADASSNFGPNNKWGFFPSFSLGWVVSEESFMEAVEGVMDWVKIRAGYGEVGNQNIPSYRYGQTLATINSAWGPAFIPGNVANPDVKWEATTSTNLGLELGFLNSRIRLDADFYIKKSVDFLFESPMPDYYGADAFNPPYVNLGEMTNRGIDLSLKTINVKNTNGFSWTSDFVLSMYQNELTKLANKDDVIYQIIQFNQTITRTGVGQPVGQFYGYVTDGIFKTEEEIRNSPVQGDGTIDETSGTWIGDIKFKDISGPDGVPDGVIDDNDRTYIGSAHPDFTFSINNQLSYKNLDLAISLYGSYGNEIYNWNRKMTEGMTDPYGNQSINVANRFRAGINEDTEFPRYAPSDPNNNARVSDRFVEDGSFLRIQNITLGYTLPSSILQKTNIISNLRAYFTVQNVYTFTNYTGYDPSVNGGHSGNALLAGVDNGRYPIPRTYTLGLKIDF